MWSLYTGQLPYVVGRAGVLCSNPFFPHFPKAGHAAHLQYTCLAERCLQRDPHERPSFKEIALTLLDFFNRPCGAPGPPQPAPPSLSIVVPGPCHPPPATSTPAPAADRDGLVLFSSSQLSYIDSRYLLAACLSPAAGTQQQQVAEVQAHVWLQQQQQVVEVQAHVSLQQQQVTEVQAHIGQQQQQDAEVQSCMQILSLGG